MARTDKILTVPGTIDISTNLDTHKNTSQVKWVTKDWYARTKDDSDLTPTHGDTTKWISDPSGNLRSSGNVYSSREDEGMNYFGDAGKQHSQIVEQIRDSRSRWMPANIFNGIGFEVRQTSSNSHAPYLKKWCLVFDNYERTGIRRYAFDLNKSSPAVTYLYLKIPGNSGAAQEIRSWGNEWLLRGIACYMYQNSGGTGSGTGNIYVYNLKVGHKYGTLGGQYRMIPAGLRSHSERNTGTPPFTDPFVY